MRFIKWTLKCLGIFIGILLLLLIIFSVYVYNISDIKPPKIADTTAYSLQVAHPEGSLHTIGNNWIRKNQFGLYEMYVSGSPFERGVINGKLSQQQIVDQEVAFTNQIKLMVPSSSYLKFLKYVVGFINRSLPENVPDEYKQEIYGVSHAAADSFNWIGTNYSRILNYHAAHDIGHALQNMMLVGCTSFGAWGGKTTNGEMLLGRNFDFYVGDEFAAEKIIAFYNPDKGHKFMFVTWGGFTGVASGMNDKGLTVTINAARSDIPTDAATPVSLVAREILQYAGNIKEAIAIAQQRKMFVSESFLIGSAADHKAVLLEKTPDKLAVYDPQQDHILCTNHYQSKEFEHQELNIIQKKKSASVYREARLNELMEQQYPLTPEKVAAILRDRKGLHGADIGNGNEKAVNQLIAHHSIIFKPDSLQVWVSTAPWQLGTYVCYDLRKIFAMNGLQHDVEVADNDKNIAPDPFLNTPDFRQFMKYHDGKVALMQKRPIDTAIVAHAVPNFYDGYRIAGDYSKSKGWYNAAIGYYNEALTHEVATEDEREGMERKIKECRKEMSKH